MKDTVVILFLQNNLPLKSSRLPPKFYNRLLATLKLRFCNLPVCSAQASFLLNRKSPVLDRFIAQFFSLTMSQAVFSYHQFDMNSVLSDIDPVDFIIEDDGTRKCRPRLAVYQSWNYKANRSLFVAKLIPELLRMAKSLNMQGITYRDISGVYQNFTCVDIEMAVFAFSSEYRKFFQCFYEENPTKLNLRHAKV